MDVPKKRSKYIDLILLMILLVAGLVSMPVWIIYQSDTLVSAEILMLIYIICSLSGAILLYRLNIYAVKSGYKPMTPLKKKIMAFTLSFLFIGHIGLAMFLVTNNTVAFGAVKSLITPIVNKGFSKGNHYANGENGDDMHYVYYVFRGDTLCAGFGESSSQRIDSCKTIKIIYIKGLFGYYYVEDYILVE